MSGRRHCRPSRRRAAALSCAAALTVVTLAGCGDASSEVPVGDRLPPTAGGTGASSGTVPASPSLPSDFPEDVAFPIGQYSIASVTGDDDSTTVVLDGMFDLDVELAHLTAAFEADGYSIDHHTRAASDSIDQLYLEISGADRSVSVSLINQPSGGVATYEVTPHP